MAAGATKVPAMKKITRGTGGAGSRNMKTKVKSGRLKPSSRRWLERQLNDPYVARAKAEGYRSRAAFKLMEIDDRYHILKPGDRVIDLGAAPGGWTQIAADRVQSSSKRPAIVAVDYLGMDALPGAIILESDFMDNNTPDEIIAALGGDKANLVLSDMAAPTTGHAATDHLRIMALCEAAAEFAALVLAPGGHFLAKVFRGGAEQVFLAGLKRDFTKVHHVKPPASRAQSAELYLLATGFRGKTG